MLVKGIPGDYRDWLGDFGSLRFREFCTEIKLLGLGPLLQLLKLNRVQVLSQTMKWMCDTRSRLVPELSWTQDLADGSPKRYVGTMIVQNEMKCRVLGLF